MVYANHLEGLAKPMYLEETIDIQQVLAAYEYALKRIDTLKEATSPEQINDRREWQPPRVGRDLGFKIPHSRSESHSANEDERD